MSIYLKAFGMALFYVGLRSTQQLNVFHKQYKFIPFVSMLMAGADYLSINWMVHNNWHIAIAIGLGGATGAIISTALHSKLMERKSGKAGS